MRIDNRFEDLDRAALHNALLALHTCPRCRNELQPVALFEDVWGCKACKETWHLPQENKPKKRQSGVCRHTVCRHCDQDIEGFWPYRKGEWRDRGNNTSCPFPAEGKIHAPVQR